MSSKEMSNSLTTPQEHIPDIPDFGWRVRLDYECRDKASPFITVRIKQFLPVIGMCLRYLRQWMKWKRQNRKPFIDHFNPVAHKPMYGCPIGGIGCGTIGRGYRGEFCRFQMIPGNYDYKVVHANQFIVCIRKNGQTVYQKVLTGGKRHKSHLKAWHWGVPHENVTYHALYPRAWTVYNIPEHHLTLTCRQVSPVYPHEYKDTSFPMAVFVWKVENHGEDALDVSIMFTFKNGRGVKDDSQGGCWNEPFEVEDVSRGSNSGAISGVMIHQTLQDMKCTYSIAGAAKEGVHVSHRVHFDPKGTGADVWDDLFEDGRLQSSSDCSSPTAKGQHTAVAVCVATSVPPHDTRNMDLCLTWDMPVIHFRAQGKRYLRRYTRWFSPNGDAAQELCSYALHHYPMWESKIEAWQNPILQCNKLPAWYKSALFNELYYVSDGGTVWIDPAEVKDGVVTRVYDSSLHPVIQEYSRFAYLEGQEYRMYNTYDVHHYASFSLIMLWPKLQMSLQYDIAKAVVSEDTEPIKFCMEGSWGIRKVMNSVPHDMGDPEDEPWSRVNAYIIHPTNDWKDLNMKFVLQVYRDYIATEDDEFLKHMYPAVKAVMETAVKWDTDNDGIIDNGGFADQTFDNWIMTGASAYCGGMWLAALRMVIEMAKILSIDDDVQLYTEILDRGKQSYETKLWNGKYYNYDCSDSGYHDSIMADQLAGHWFLKASGLQDDSVFPPDHVQKALRTIFDNNVMGFENGNMGAINGTRPNGKKDINSVQSEEFWVGVTYGLAASMFQENMLEEGFQTAWGTYHFCWERVGLAFQTPEAYMTSCHYRSLGYMRPLAVWSMQWALERFHPDLLDPSKQETVSTAQIDLTKTHAAAAPGGGDGLSLEAIKLKEAPSKQEVEIQPLSEASFAF